MNQNMCKIKNKLKVICSQCIQLISIKIWFMKKSNTFHRIVLPRHVEPPKETHTILERNLPDALFTGPSSLYLYNESSQCKSVRQPYMIHAQTLTH